MSAVGLFNTGCGFCCQGCGRRKGQRSTADCSITKGRRVLYLLSLHEVSNEQSHCQCKVKHGFTTMRYKRLRCQYLATRKAVNTPNLWCVAKVPACTCIGLAQVFPPFARRATLEIGRLTRCIYSKAELSWWSVHHKSIRHKPR